MKTEIIGSSSKEAKPTPTVVMTSTIAYQQNVEPQMVFDINSARIRSLLQKGSTSQALREAFRR